MGACSQFHEPGEQQKQPAVVAPGLVAKPGQIQGDVLDGDLSSFPWRIFIRTDRLIARRRSGGRAAVKNEAGVSLFDRYPTEEVEEGVLPRGMEKPLRQMDQRPRKDERLSGGVPFPEHLEQGNSELPGFRRVISVGPAGLLTAGADGRHVFEGRRHVPVQVNIREHGLSAPCGRELREFIDQHLGKLADLPIRTTGQIGGKRIIDVLPADGSGAVTLQHGAEADQVRQDDLRVAGRPGNGHGMGEVEPVLLDVFRGLAGTVHPVDVAQGMDVDISHDVGLADLP